MSSSETDRETERQTENTQTAGELGRQTDSKSRQPANLADRQTVKRPNN